MHQAVIIIIVKFTCTERKASLQIKESIQKPTIFLNSNKSSPSGEKRALKISLASWFSRNGRRNACPAVNLNVWPSTKMAYLGDTLGNEFFFEAVFLRFIQDKIFSAGMNIFLIKKNTRGPFLI